MTHNLCNKSKGAQNNQIVIRNSFILKIIPQKNVMGKSKIDMLINRKILIKFKNLKKQELNLVLKKLSTIVRNTFSNLNNNIFHLLIYIFIHQKMIKINTQLLKLQEIKINCQINSSLMKSKQMFISKDLKISKNMCLRSYVKLRLVICLF